MCPHIDKQYLLCTHLQILIAHVYIYITIYIYNEICVLHFFGNKYTVQSPLYFLDLGLSPTKVTSMEDFDRRFPAYGGFLPWCRWRASLGVYKSGLGSRNNDDDDDDDDDDDAKLVNQKHRWVGENLGIMIMILKKSRICLGGILLKETVQVMTCQEFDWWKYVQLNSPSWSDFPSPNQFVHVSFVTQPP